MRAVRWTLGFALGSAIVVFVAPAVLVLAGFHPLLVRGGSMAPVLHTGDAVIVRIVPARAVAVGDIVTLSDLRFGGSVTHRLISRTRNEGGIDLVTKGDASAGSERWSLAAEDRVGRFVVRVPAVGRAVSFLALPLTRGVLIIMIFMLMLTNGGTEQFRRRRLT